MDVDLALMQRVNNDDIGPVLHGIGATRFDASILRYRFRVDPMGLHDAEAIYEQVLHATGTTGVFKVQNRAADPIRMQPIHTGAKRSFVARDDQHSQQKPACQDAASENP